jgi:hypothetical protein
MLRVEHVAHMVEKNKCVLNFVEKYEEKYQTGELGIDGYQIRELGIDGRVI